VDEAAANLILNLCDGNMTIEQVVDNMMTEVGTDPNWNRRLDFFPADSGDKAIEKLTR